MFILEATKIVPLHDISRYLYPRDLGDFLCFATTLMCQYVNKLPQCNHDKGLRYLNAITMNG
jgi:hypothetical protein